jgi:hypothetical protein
VTVPAIATTIVKCGPRISKEVKSMTKDSGMVPQSSVVDCRIARVEVRIAANIKPENSRVRWGCGQYANPRNTPAPIAIAANATTPERRSGVIQATSAPGSISRFTPF